MKYLSPRPNHRARWPYTVYLLDKSLADFLAGDLSIYTLAGDIEKFVITFTNDFDQLPEWFDHLDYLYGYISIPVFSEKEFTESEIAAVRPAIINFRRVLAEWWEQNITVTSEK